MINCRKNQRKSSVAKKMFILRRARRRAWERVEGRVEGIVGVVNLLDGLHGNGRDWGSELIRGGDGSNDRRGGL